MQPLHTEHARGSDMLRLHCNEHPYGPPPGVIAQVTKELESRCATYPDSCATLLRDRLAQRYGVTPEMVAVGNGADELVLLISLACIRPDDTVVVTESTFPGYATSAAVATAAVRTVPLVDDRVPVAGLKEAMEDGARLVYICNPHNPTGTVLAAAAVEEILADAERTGTIAVFDEAYMEFAGPAYEHAMHAVRAGRRLLVLRTFSKAWGLAALRAGYVVGPPDLIADIQRTRQALPFNVNRLAQQAAVAALDSEDHIEETRAGVTEARERLCRGLARLGVEFVPSVTNFVLVTVPGDSARFAARLADEHGILVRDLTLFGLPGRVRVTVGTPEKMDRFCAAVRELLVPPRPAGLGHGLGAARDTITVPTLEAIAPQTLFNGYIGSQVVFALNQLDVWERLSDGTQSLDSLIAATKAEATRLLAMLRAAALLGYVEIATDGEHRVSLTAAGRDLVRHKGFFTWGVGGYHDILGGLSDLALGSSVFERDLDRDGKMVAVGSGEVGKAMMLPPEAELLASVDFRSVADLGCGDATRLLRLCGQDTARRGTGIEINEAACTQANKRVSEAGLADRIEIVHGDVLNFSDRVFPGVDLVASFLMMHDLFEATGDPVGVMRTLRRVFPDAERFLIGDTAAQDWQEQRAPLPVFSVGFELVHAFMDTPIMNRATYEDAFAGADLRIAHREPLGAPSTWLWLLSAD
ncbi:MULTISPECIES: histidinol-phosphate transaminase [unclassified Streptomyces]|uniref:histidinol-phosphate transaminase n=1 Tax=unclassified Streptomyces TaxID=2593676 RepID=UPI0023B0F7A7|nr:histidinol-phosphate transaminase [Streptomyces sp. SceaMP-e96]